MKTKTKALIALIAGALIVAFGLYFGVSGDMHSSISERGKHIARWEKELVEDKQKLEVYMAELDALGKKTNPTPEEVDKFRYGMEHLEQKTRSLQYTRERITNERDHKQQQILITAGLSAVGIVAILFGVVLLRRSRRHFA